MAETKNFMAKLVRAWPALPYMALGALLASVYIASSGTAWLSDSETNGGNLSVLTVTTSLSAGGLMLLSTFAVPRVRSWLERPTACLWAGAVSSLGALIVILIGPYYLTPMLPYSVIRSLFFVGGIFFGVGLGTIALRCGQLYGALPPRQVVLYVAYSQFVAGASFFIVLGSPAWAPVPGGPSLAGMAAFVLLPLAAGILASFSRYIEQPTPTLVRDHSRRSLPKSFWKLLAVVFVFSCIVSSVYASTVAVSSIETTLSGSRLVMLARMLLALVLAVVAVGTEGDRLNFGKLYSVVMVASVALVACLPLVTVLHTVLAQVVSLSSVVFELFLWCILAFIVFQRRTSAVIVFGYGYGAYQLGNGIGWLFGAQLLGTLFGAVGEAFAYMIMALIVLACAFLIFSEREFDRLFAPGEEGVCAMSHDEILRIEEIERLVAVAAGIGIRSVRLTGGEPLVRKGVVDLVDTITGIEGIENVSMTTNGVLLPRMIDDLKAAGLSRVNISLDTLDADQFHEITRTGRLEDTLAGIDAALGAGLNPVKVNAVAVRSLNQDFLEFAKLSIDRPLHVRFIEYMPVGDTSVDAGTGWGKDDVIPSEELFDIINERAAAAGLPALRPAGATKPLGWGPARYFEFPDALGTVGFISPLSRHFCSECNRLRVTADGKVRPCLFSDTEYDVRTALREGDDAAVRDVLLTALGAKPDDHHDKVGTDRKMSQIGG